MGQDVLVACDGVSIDDDACTYAAVAEHAERVYAHIASVHRRAKHIDFLVRRINIAQERTHVSHITQAGVRLVADSDSEISHPLKLIPPRARNNPNHLSDLPKVNLHPRPLVLVVRCPGGQ